MTQEPIRAEDIRRAEGGRGTGVGQDYLPWIQLGEFPGWGEEKEVPGRKIKRGHVLFSQLERAFLEISEARPEVTDIREQFPLQLTETLAIAKDIVVRHPRDYATKTIFIMSTDFLLDTENGQEAWSIKNSKELTQERTLQKLEIEQEYWKRLGVPWRLYTEKEAGPNNKKNTKFLAEAPLFHGAVYPAEKKAQIKALAEKLLTEKGWLVSDLGTVIDTRLGLTDEALHILKEILRNREWDFNSYHGDLSKNTFRLERHWTGEPVLRAECPMTGFEEEHKGSDIPRIRRELGEAKNEKFKIKRRAKAAAMRKPKPPREPKPKPQPKPKRAVAQMVGFPRPHRDELVFSILCRVHKKMGSPAVYGFNKLILGLNSNPGTVIPQYCEKIAEHFPEGDGMTGEELEKNYGLAPFLLRWGPDPEKTKTQVVSHLKSCPACRAEDIEKLGESYWRRMHQIEGISHCHWHGYGLEKAVEGSLRQGEGRSWLPVYFGPEDCTWEAVKPGDWKTEGFFLREVRDILRGRSLPWDLQRKSLLGEMERRGYTRGKQIDGGKILGEAAERFGDRLEKLFHLTNDDRGRRIISNIIKGDDADPHRLMFLHCFLKLAVREEREAAELKPRDGRESRAAKPTEIWERRKQFLKASKNLKWRQMKELPEYRGLLETDRSWIEKIVEDRKKRNERSDQKWEKLDAEAAQLVKETSKRMRENGELERIERDSIIREAGKKGHIIRKCAGFPLTSTAITESVDTDKSIIRRRLNWGRENAADCAKYEFLCKAKLRGIELPDWAEKEIEETIRIRNTQLQEQANKKDLEEAKRIREAGAILRSGTGRPIQVQRGNLLAEAGIRGMLGPESEKTLSQEIDTQESLWKRRVAWGQTVIPKGKAICRYDLKRVLGIRGWRKQPDPRELVNVGSSPTGGT
jgi:hypothetical protein